MTFPDLPSRSMALAVNNDGPSAPSASIQSDGWPLEAKPASSDFNYLGRAAHDWQQYYLGATAQLLTTAPNNGWIPLPNYTTSRTVAADPTYEITVSGVDLSTIIKEGCKLQLTQNSTVRYFYVQKSVGGASTVITLFGGTDYDVDDTTTFAITDIKFSYGIAPSGFTVDPAKWVGAVILSGLPVYLGIEAVLTRLRILENLHTDALLEQTAGNGIDVGTTGTKIKDSVQVFGQNGMIETGKIDPAVQNTWYNVRQFAEEGNGQIFASTENGSLVTCEREFTFGFNAGLPTNSSNAVYTLGAAYLQIQFVGANTLQIRTTSPDTTIGWTIKFNSNRRQGLGTI